MAEQTPAPGNEPEDCFDEECYLCGATDDLRRDPNFDYLYICARCLQNWENHLEQIHERDEPPPSVE